MRCLLATMLCVVLGMAAIADEPAVSQRQGRVTGEDGAGIEGATVRIIGANPRAGEDVVCPSNLLSVGRSYTTDASGGYLMEELDPNLTYEIAVSAAGHKPHVIAAASGKASLVLVTKLKSQAAELDKDAMVSGRVVDDDGQPIRGAVVEIFGESRQHGNGHSRQFGGISDVDEAGVAGSDGAFSIGVKGPGRTFYVKLRAAGFAPQVVEIKGGEAADALKMTRGAAITGRLVKEGKPMAGVMMRLAQTNLNAESSVGFFSIGTDADGRYRFEHLPLNDEFQFTAAMDSLGSRGSTAVATARTGAEVDGTADAGDLNVDRAVTVSGQFVLPDGVEKVPTGTKVTISNGNLAGGTFPVASDGTFKAVGLRSGVVTLRLTTTLRISPENVSYLPGSHALMGRIEGDTELKVKLLPRGDQVQDGWSSEKDQELRGKPLQGMAE